MQCLATARTAGRRIGNGGMRGRGMGVQDREVGGCSGRQVVGQLNECQSTVEPLTLLLEAALGGTSPLAALLLLCGLFLVSILFIRLEKLHWILLLLVLCSGFALWLHLGGCRGALLTGLPVPARTEYINIKYKFLCKTVVSPPVVEQYVSPVCTYFANHSATALLSTDWAFPRSSFGSSLFRREKGCLGQ